MDPVAGQDKQSCFVAWVKQCDETGGPLSHPRGSQHGSATSRRGSFGNIRENAFGKTISLPRKCPTNRGNSESLQALQGQWKLMGEKQQEKLNKADTSC
eukprot:bmy_21484T0